jgi:hypothetical protein
LVAISVHFQPNLVRPGYINERRAARNLEALES